MIYWAVRYTSDSGGYIIPDTIRDVMGDAIVAWQQGRFDPRSPSPCPWSLRGERYEVVQVSVVELPVGKGKGVPS